MNTKRTAQTALLTGVMAAGFALPALADTMLPQPMHEGNITYISGGIGFAEQEALKSSARNYNLEITNANKAGQFATDTDLVITSKNGREMMRVDNTGPLFYAKLPKGEYVIRATNGDQHEVRDVKISAKNVAGVHMIWKQS